MKKENESAHQPAMTKYMRIYTDTKNLILSGHYRDGDQLPEEAAVCEKYGCSRMTVKSLRHAGGRWFYLPQTGTGKFCFILFFKP